MDKSFILILCNTSTPFYGSKETEADANVELYIYGRSIDYNAVSKHKYSGVTVYFSFHGGHYIFNPHDVTHE